MTSDNRDDGLEPIFEARITPYRSLSHTGFFVVMGIFTVVNFTAGIMFYLAGAWPIFGFCALDVLLLYWAFRINYRSAAAYELVRVTPIELRVRQVSHRGRIREWALNPLWVTLDKISDEEFGIVHLFLVSRGKRLAIASFLGPDEKASFAQALSEALWTAKRGVTRTLA